VTGQKQDFLSLLNHKTTFGPYYDYKKYENAHFIFQYKKYYHHISFRYNFILSYAILFRTVISCIVLFSIADKCTQMNSTNSSIKLFELDDKHSSLFWSSQTFFFTKVKHINLAQEKRSNILIY
jgi:hypothetical protein